MGRTCCSNDDGSPAAADPASQASRSKLVAGMVVFMGMGAPNHRHSLEAGVKQHRRVWQVEISRACRGKQINTVQDGRGVRLLSLRDGSSPPDSVASGGRLRATTLVPNPCCSWT